MHVHVHKAAGTTSCAPIFGVIDDDGGGGGVLVN